MIISILIPNFWIAVEERRCPELRGRPVIVGDGFLEKTGGQAKVLMSNELAAAFGVRPSISLAHARQLCPEAVFVSPEMPLYAGVWDEIVGLLLTYTPLVEQVEPGEALCDVTGCERLFGDPVTLAGEIVNHIGSSSGLPIYAGVASNRLVAQLAARNAAESISNRRGEREKHADSSTLKVQRPKPVTCSLTSAPCPPGPVTFIPPGDEAVFLAPFPITSLPEIDANILLAFQVLGIKTVEHLAHIPEKAVATRFGKLGGRLARYARGKDDRSVRPTLRAPTVTVTRSPTEDIFEGLDVDVLIHRLAEILAEDLVSCLHEQRLAGRLVRLILRGPREGVGSIFKVQRSEKPGDRNGCSSLDFEPSSSPTISWDRLTPSSLVSSPNHHRLDAGAPETPAATLPTEQFFPNQDSRIHSMLPQPKQPGRTHYLDALPGITAKSSSGKSELSGTVDPNPFSSDGVEAEAGITIKAVVRAATNRPVDDFRTIAELTHRLLDRALRSAEASETGVTPDTERRTPRLTTHNSGSPYVRLTQPGFEVVLEMSQFAPQEQLTLPGLDERPIDGRVAKLHRQENVLTARFGATPFRHLEALNLDSVLSEKVFRWGGGMR